MPVVVLAKIISGTIVGIQGQVVSVEVDITRKGFGSFKIVGLAGKSVDESRDRVRTAIENSQLDFPRYRVTVNLAPADLPKEGPVFDLPIAVGTMIANGDVQKTPETQTSMFAGELSLDGSLNSTPAILPLALLARKNGIETIFVPAVNAKEAAIVRGIKIYPVPNLKSLVLHLNGEQQLEQFQGHTRIKTVERTSNTVTLEHVRGQEYAKRALTISAAGSHNIMFSGPPGTGKTLLAKCLPALLPPLTYEESLQVTQIHSVTHQLNPDQPLINLRPFRSPHHTTSRAGLIGGGTHLTPGEISLAHRGVLFLDELPEFPRSVLESLRQPIEDGTITISRARGSVEYPASFMLVATSNPCPCGYLGSRKRTCSCPPNKIQHYQRRLSGPLLDRIDLFSFVYEVDINQLIQKTAHSSESDSPQTKDAHTQITLAHTRQQKRFKGHSITFNSEMSSQDIARFCPLDQKCNQTLVTAGEKLNLSARSIHKVIKVARTIADLDDQDQIQELHLVEALNYRRKESEM